MDDARSSLARTAAFRKLVEVPTHDGEMHLAHLRRHPLQIGIFDNYFPTLEDPLRHGLQLLGVLDVIWVLAPLSHLGHAKTWVWTPHRDWKMCGWTGGRISSE